MVFILICSPWCICFLYTFYNSSFVSLVTHILWARQLWEHSFYASWWPIKSHESYALCISDFYKGFIQSGQVHVILRSREDVRTTCRLTILNHYPKQTPYSQTEGTFCQAKCTYCLYIIRLQANVLSMSNSPTIQRYTFR